MEEVQAKAKTLTPVLNLIAKDTHSASYIIEFTIEGSGAVSHVELKGASEEASTNTGHEIAGAFYTLKFRPKSCGAFVVKKYPVNIVK